MTLHDLERLIQLKVRFQCGKPDERMLLLSKLTMQACLQMNPRVLTVSDKSAANELCI